MQIPAVCLFSRTCKTVTGLLSVACLLQRIAGAALFLPLSAPLGGLGPCG